MKQRREKNSEKFNKTKNCFLKEINKIDRLLVRQMKKKGEDSNY